MNEDSLEILASALGQLLLAHGWKVTTAESCTGGGIAQAITAVPGSSDWFEQGFVTYSNRAKQRQLQLDEALLTRYGAVSQPVVEAMAKAAWALADANIAVAVSGIAGPGGGSDQKPVGTVWIAWYLDRQVLSRVFHFSGPRAQVRRQAIYEALEGLIEVTQKNTV